MFTGIIEQVGRVRARQTAPGGCRLEIVPAPPFEGLRIGESVAVDGACLTAEAGSSPERLSFFLSAETLTRTTLGGLALGAEVNLERALAVGDRFGGHFVLGHVDAVGHLIHLRPQGEAWELAVACPAEIGRFLAPKGSIAVDGISLTIVEARPTAFTVAIVPHTLRQTTLQSKSAGASVNLEVDVIARYVRRFLEGAVGAGAVDLELLERAGFIETGG